MGDVFDGDLFEIGGLLVLGLVAGIVFMTIVGQQYNERIEAERMLGEAYAKVQCESLGQIYDGASIIEELPHITCKTEHKNSIDGQIYTIGGD